MLADWTAVKSVLQGRSISAQYVTMGSNYWIKAIDGIFDLECIIPTDTSNAETQDFIDNFKTDANTAQLSQVQTQFEAKDKTLKLFSAQADVQEDGTATILAKVPGTPGGSDGRWISSGEAFFSTPNAGDKILGVWFIDHDNLLGSGVDFVVGSYTDDAADPTNQGWYLPPVRGTVKAETIGFYGFAPSGFYLKIIGQKVSGIITGKLFVNLEWGTSE